MLVFWTLLAFCCRSVEEWIVLRTGNACVFINRINDSLERTRLTNKLILVKQWPLDRARNALRNVWFIGKRSFWASDTLLVDRIVSWLVKRTWNAFCKISRIKKCSDWTCHALFSVFIKMRLCNWTWKTLNDVFWIDVLVCRALLTFFCLVIVFRRVIGAS